MTEYVAEGEYRRQAMQLLSMFNLMMARKRHEAIRAGEPFSDMDPVRATLSGMEFFCIGRSSLPNGRVPLVGTAMFTGGWMAKIEEKVPRSKVSVLKVFGDTEAFERDMMYRKFLRS